MGPKQLLEEKKRLAGRGRVEDMASVAGATSRTPSCLWLSVMVQVRGSVGPHGGSRT